MFYDSTSILVCNNCEDLYTGLSRSLRGIIYLYHNAPCFPCNLTIATTVMHAVDLCYIRLEKEQNRTEQKFYYT